LAGSGRVSEPRLPPPNDDSDTDCTDTDEDTVVEEEESPTQTTTEKEATTEEEAKEKEEVFGWLRNTTFEGIDTKKLFNDEFQKRATRNADDGTRVGVQCSTNSVNSPIKAWSQIFTVLILNRIVQYTNDYGSVKCKDWVNITRSDITDFFCVLFISSIQKRKDPPSNWWSNNVLLESTIIK
jgi:Transposase IS4